MIKSIGWILMLSALPFTGNAQQTDDPVLIKVNGNPVTRSEFEYLYHKNNDLSSVAKTSLDDYVNLFTNYRLKVEAAKAARLDTLSSFRKEFLSYRNMQLIPHLIDTVFVDSIARSVYSQLQKELNGADMVRVAHVFVKVPQKASDAERKKAENKIDSIYDLIKKGNDFSEIAKQCSEDHSTAQAGGLLPWIGPKSTLKEFEDVAYSLQPGQLSKPFLSTAGYHIILMKERKGLESFAEKKREILYYLEAQGLNNIAFERQIKKLIKDSGNKLTKDDILENAEKELTKSDPQLKYLINEYYDGLLLYEISNREVWSKTSKDTVAVEDYFKKHKRNYSWDEPRFKGFVYLCKNSAQLKDVKNILKKHKNGDWASILREKYNSKEPKQVLVVQKLFKVGDNPYVDKVIFKKEEPLINKDYPYYGCYGEKLKKNPKDVLDVFSQVLSDYQEEKEKEWVESLRKQFIVEVDRNVLKTVK